MNTNVTMKLDQLEANPYRDLNLFPINGVVVDSLKESINDTDFWDNLVVRLKGNALCDGTPISSAAELTALFESGHDFSKEVFELCYGHHRKAALGELNWENVTLPVKFVDDTTMLKMMANENKDSSMNQIAVKLETYRQVKQSIEDEIATYKNFTDYKKNGSGLYANKQGFTNALDNGVGFKTVKKFLGESWSETDIRYSANVVGNIEAGYFLQEDIIDIPSIGLLQAIGSIAGFLLEGDAKKEQDAPDWPSYFKTAALDTIIERCKPDAKGWQKVTVAQLRKAKSLMVNEGVNPASFVRSGNVKNAFDITKATKDLVFDKDKDEAVNMEALEELRDKEGFSDYHDLDELVKRVGASMKKSLERGDGKDDDEELGEVDGGELEKQIAEADGEVAVPNMFEAGDMGEEGEDAVMPVGHLIAAYVQTTSHMIAGAEALAVRAEEIGEDAALDKAAEELLASTASFVFARLGKAALVEAFNNVTG